MHNFMNNQIVLNDMKHIASRREDWGWLKNTSILITGAYGMLVSYTVFFLIYLNETIPDMNITILAQGRNKEKMRDRFGMYMDRAYFHTLSNNICEPLMIDDPVDYMIHAASLASPQYYKTNPVDTLLPNVIGTYHLLEFARKKQVEGFLLFSSGDVYGVLPENLTEVTETDDGYMDPMNIRSCYGESKRMAENMCKSWAMQYGVPAKSVRICHTYGPTMDIQNDQRVFAEFVRNIVDGKDIVMKSDGSATRPFCYLADATDAFLRILKDGGIGEAYNMCNNSCLISIRALAEQLVALYPEENLKVIVQAREANSAYMESQSKKTPPISVKKLQSLGWNPHVGIAEGFHRTIVAIKDEHSKNKS